MFQRSARQEVAAIAQQDPLQESQCLSKMMMTLLYVTKLKDGGFPKHLLAFKLHHDCPKGPRVPSISASPKWNNLSAITGTRHKASIERRWGADCPCNGKQARKRLTSRQEYADCG